MTFVERELKKRNIAYIPTGENFRIKCPFHREKDPSCMVHMKTGGFNCFGCSEAGTFNMLLGRIDGRPVTIIFDQSERVVKRKIVKLKETILTEQFIDVRENKQAMKYLHKRDIYNFDDFNLRYCLFSKSSKWDGRIIFPIYTLDGMFLSISGRTIFNGKPEKRKYPGISIDTFYGATHLQHKRVVVIVEGELDTVYLQQFGIPAVGLLGTGGRKLSDIQFSYLVSFDRVVLSLDGDDSGQKASKALIKQLNPFTSVRWLELPYGKDPNDFSYEEVEKLYKPYCQVKNITFKYH